jgi:hypothetical protein
MSAMTRKQIVYREMLSWTLPHLRNISTWSWWRRLRDQSAYYEAELIHNLPVSMFEPDFVEHDIWFLNVQARAYYEQCSEQISPLYLQQVALLRELFSLVPAELRPKLKWSGPDEKDTRNAA